jgi:hypothetical protein
LLQEGRTAARVQRRHADVQRSVHRRGVYALRPELHRLDEHDESRRVRMREHEVVVRERYRLASAVIG